MARVRIFNRLITKDGFRGYEAYVGQISQVVIPEKWVRKNIRFNGEDCVDYEY